ncbi:MAG TPA: amino acid transporter [Candidatus Limnocylindria bacterium]|nr:amino acid transporter [Candidatus Limnocylindria bacterium]
MTQDAAAAAEAPAHRWEPLSLDEVRQTFAGVEAPWWIAGGWALDLFIGHETRSHVDTDVAILRRDQHLFRERLGSWDVRIAHEGELLPWPAKERITKSEHHEAWARPSPDGPWRVELLLEESDGKRWSYRRDARIGLHVADLGRRDASGIPYVRPEVVLLYKSKGSRPVDETDLLYALPRLDPAQRGWLYAALYTIDPAHRWLARLK